MGFRWKFCKVFLVLVWIFIFFESFRSYRDFFVDIMSIEILAIKFYYWNLRLGKLPNGWIFLFYIFYSRQFNFFESIHGNFHKHLSFPSLFPYWQDNFDKKSLLYKIKLNLFAKLASKKNYNAKLSANIKRN